MNPMNRMSDHDNALTRRRKILKDLERMYQAIGTECDTGMDNDPNSIAKQCALIRKTSAQMATTIQQGLELIQQGLESIEKRVKDHTTKKPDPIWIVALMLEKNIPGGTSTTQTLSYCQCKSQQDALDHAILFAYKEKPGFAVLAHLINQIDPTTLNLTAKPEKPEKPEKEAK